MVTCWAEWLADIAADQSSLGKEQVRCYMARHAADRASVPRVRAESRCSHMMAEVRWTSLVHTDRMPYPFAPV